MYRIQYYFIVNGDWEEGHVEETSDVPSKDSVLFVEGTPYSVKKVNQHEYGYDVYLD